MMIYENDKLEIPEKYRKMSVSELREEKEKIYATIKTEKKSSAVNKAVVGSVIFNI
ncbi:MAG: hypothetical protein PUF13_04625 [Lachnospiraceae bacterium]|nr:hypothetical protein [Lachnospiraceae bacterium]